MTPKNDSLLQRLGEFQLDDPECALCFSARLAKENGWSPDYSRRVVGEYKRFLYLAMTAGHMVTPSEQVDQAWHQHLTYTHSYWQELCGDVLGRPLHHDPTKGGREETLKYRALYERTLRSYHAAFGEFPPEDIWPDTDARFGSDLASRRVNTSECWVIPKPTKWLQRRFRSRRQEAIVLGLFPLFFAAWNPFDLRGPEFLALFGITYAFSLVVALFVRNQSRKEFGEASQLVEAKVTDPYEAAFLAGGERRVAQAATANLVANGVFEIRKSTRRLETNLPLSEDAHQVEKAVYAAAVATNGKAEGRLFDSLAADGLRRIRNRLAAQGLVETPTSFAAARFWSVAAMTPVMALGMIKFFVGFSRDKPVGFLIIGLVVTAITMGWFAFRRPRSTAAGQRLLRRLKSEFEGREKTKQFASDEGLSTNMAMSIALLGMGATLAPTDPLMRLYSPTSGSSGWASDMGSGCGSGGGGGGCGGGCGGCGG